MRSKIDRNNGSAFLFNAPLTTIEGNYVKHGIFLPREITKLLPAKRLRVKGTINEEPFALAIQYRKNGDRFFMISKKLVKSSKLVNGVLAKVKFKLVDPDLVELPDELEAVIEQDEEAKEVWASFTNGLKRSLIHYITSAKNIDIRIKRSLELMDKAKRGILLTQKATSNSKKR